MQLDIARRQPLGALVTIAIAMTWSTLTLASRPAEVYQAQEGLRTEQDQVNKINYSSTVSLASTGYPEVFANSGPLAYGKLQLKFISGREDPDVVAFRIEGGNEPFSSPFVKLTSTKVSDTTGTASASLSFDSETGRWFLEAVKPHVYIDLDKISQCDLTVNLEDIGDIMLATSATLKLWKDGAAGRAVGATLGAVANGIGGFGLGAFDALTSHAKLQPKRDPIVDATPETSIVEFWLPPAKRAQAEQHAAQLQQQQAQRAARTKVRLTPKTRESSPAEQQTNCQKETCAIGDTVTGTLPNRGQFVGTIQFVFDDGRIAVNDMKSTAGGPLGIGSHAFQPSVLQRIQNA